MQLALLGTPSLLAQIDAENTEVWRYANGIGSVLGALAIYVGADRGRRSLASVSSLAAIGMITVNLGTADSGSHLGRGDAEPRQR